jgi:hypothetical protein
MKILTAIISVCTLISCGDKSTKSVKHEQRISISEIHKIISTQIPEWDSSWTTAQDSNGETYYNLSRAKFDSLSHDWTNKLKDIANNDYQYDLFEMRSTTLNPMVATFTFKMGIGSQIHYVIHGVHNGMSDTKPNTVISVASTIQGEQAAPRNR